MDVGRKSEHFSSFSTFNELENGKTWFCEILGIAHPNTVPFSLLWWIQSRFPHLCDKNEPDSIQDNCW